MGKLWSAKRVTIFANRNLKKRWNSNFVPILQWDVVAEQHWVRFASTAVILISSKANAYKLRAILLILWLNAPFDEMRRVTGIMFRATFNAELLWCFGRHDTKSGWSKHHCDAVPFD